MAFRSLTGSKGRIFSRILSLTLGLTLGVTLLSYVNLRFNYDNFLPDHDRIYKIFLNFSKEGGGIDQLTFAPLAGSLVSDCPGVEAGTRLYGSMEYAWTDENEKEHSLVSYGVDTAFFKVLDFDLLVGDPSKLGDFNNVFLAEDSAKRIFGDEDPVGRTLKDNLGNPKTVAGIFRTTPYNTSLAHFDALIPDIQVYHNFDSENSWEGTNEFLTYVKLRPGTDPEEIEDWMNGDMRDKYGIRDIMEKYGAKFMMVPVKRAEIMVGTRRQYMDFIAAITILVLILCALNYSLLSISSLVNRSRTIAVMRCTAAEKKDIWAQFMWETFFVMAVAGALASLTIFLLRDYLAATIEGPVSNLFSVRNIWVSIAVVLVFFLGAGLVPATLFASVPTAVAFRSISDKKKGWKQALLVFEIICVSFASAFLLVSVRQIRMMQDGDLGYNPKNMVYVSLLVNGGDAIFNAERDFSTLPFVESVGTANCLPCWGYMPNVPLIDEESGEVVFPFATESASPSYFSAMKMKMLEGKVFDEHSSLDEVVVSKRFAEMAGIADNPLGQIVCAGDNDGNITRRLRVIGVVDNVRSTESGRFQPIVYLNILQKLQHEDWQYGGFRTMIRLREMSQENIDAISEKYHAVYQSIDKYRVDVYEDTFNHKMIGEIHFRNLLLLVAVLSSVIAVIGLVGYISDELRRRRKEMALRRVCGAEMSGIIALMIREFSILAVPSVVSGEVAAVFASRAWLQMFEYKLTLDWWMFALTGILVLALVCIVEILLTLRITGINPAESLKIE